MGRGRGKGKKLTVVAEDHEELGSGSEEHLPDLKRGGEPEIFVKDEINEEDNMKIEADLHCIKPILLSTEETTQESGKKRKRHLHVKENSGAVLEENDSIARSTKVEETTKTIGYRQTGSRRKNKPHRAAEAVVPVMAAFKGF